VTNQPPCTEPDANADDWFVDRNGRQYPDEPFLTADEHSRIAKSVLRREGEGPEEHDRRVRRAINAAESDRKRRALQRRRHAKESCLGCPIRRACLQRVLDEGHLWGTWGGLYEEEIADVRTRL
jgi:WhiB family redox-sensing transcriptional regulator